jgi:lipopolysaccharide transport system ATP-binding protein
MSAVIRAHDLSKRYRIHAADQPYYATLRDTLSSLGRATFGRLTQGFAGKPEGPYVWSLDGVSFEIRSGEVVGVIGRNGAGKSTLLKVLSRITEPTRGWAEIRGRVGSLLEVGTGFHEELTGRENLFLSGAILGMKKADIIRRFDAIVEFAELGRFIDTPVKHYSSGMYMRLAFSVAAHLEPDVLLVDEVLAVGDIAFQNKCLAKMESIAGQGRTVLFVSHNLAAVKQLCESAIVLQHGKLVFRGSAVEGVAEYLRQGAAPPEPGVRLGTAWRDLGVDGQLATQPMTVQSGNAFSVHGVLTCAKDYGRGRISCHLSSAAQETIVAQGVEHRELGLGRIDAGDYAIGVTLPALWLTPGVYSLWFRFHSEVGSVSRDYDSPPVLLNIAGTLEGDGKSVLTVPLTWRAERVGEYAGLGT